MTLHSPFAISSRLLPGLKIGNAWLQLEFSKRPGERGRVRYQWTVDLPDGQSFTGDDLQSGCGGGTLQEGFESLLSFLSACAESLNHRHGKEPGENADLFPPAVGHWALDNRDEISMLQCEIEEQKGRLITD